MKKQNAVFWREKSCVFARAPEVDLLTQSFFVKSQQLKVNRNWFRTHLIPGLPVRICARIGSRLGRAHRKLIYPVDFFCQITASKSKPRLLSKSTNHFSNGVGVGRLHFSFSFTTTFSQSALDLMRRSLQIMVANVKISKTFWKHWIFG